MCSSGPPWMPGKIWLLIFLASSASLVRIMPPRGPRSVLWVVVVTMSAWGTGLGWRPAATRPAMWAMSTISLAPTSSAMAREPGEVERPRVGAGADHQHARLVLAAEARHLVHVDLLVGLAQAVGDHLEEPAGEVDRRAVGEVAAEVEAHGDDGVARLRQREVGGHVGLRAGVGLDVGVLGAEELAGPVDGQLLHLVDHLAAAVVALAGVALGVLVGEGRAGRLEHGRARRSSRWRSAPAPRPGAGSRRG